MHPAAADVDRVAGLLGVDAAEAEPAVGVLEGAQASGRPVPDRLLGDLGRARFGSAQERLFHAVEARVRLVEVGLLGGEIGMGHRPSD